VLFVSGHPPNFLLFSGLKVGSNFLQKPFSIQLLTAKVRELLDTSLAARRAP
jgi:DNA-binding response OmpR family regulator